MPGDLALAAPLISAFLVSSTEPQSREQKSSSHPKGHVLPPACFLQLPAWKLALPSLSPAPLQCPQNGTWLSARLPRQAFALKRHLPAPHSCPAQLTYSEYPPHCQWPGQLFLLTKLSDPGCQPHPTCYRHRWRSIQTWSDSVTCLWPKQRDLGQSKRPWH